MSILEADHARIVAEATAEARAAERRHWEARFRNAEAAHAAALADANLRWDAEVTRALDEGEKIGRLYGSTPRTLAESDPEPAVGSVVLFDGLPYIRQGNKWVAPRANSAYWYEFMRDERPTVLIHDGEATPQREVHTRDCGWRINQSVGRCTCGPAIDGEDR